MKGQSSELPGLEGNCHRTRVRSRVLQAEPEHGRKGSLETQEAGGQRGSGGQSPVRELRSISSVCYSIDIKSMGSDVSRRNWIQNLTPLLRVLRANRSISLNLSSPICTVDVRITFSVE